MALTLAANVPDALCGLRSARNGMNANWVLFDGFFDLIDRLRAENNPHGDELLGMLDEWEIQRVREIRRVRAYINERGRTPMGFPLPRSRLRPQPSRRRRPIDGLSCLPPPRGELLSSATTL